jgi:hypothetical protein
MAEFYRAHQTPILLGGVGLLLLAGVGIYMATRDDEDERFARQAFPPRRPTLPPSRPQMPLESDVQRSLVGSRPMPTSPDNIRRAAAVLGIRSDADVGSIRSAYAREASKYPRGDSDSIARRSQLRSARDTMLRARGVF